MDFLNVFISVSHRRWDIGVFTCVFLCSWKDKNMRLIDQLQAHNRTLNLYKRKDDFSTVILALGSFELN
jgi:hypothetical protein